MRVRLHAQEADRLESLTSYGLLDSAPRPAYQAFAGAAAQACDTPMALVSLVDSDRQFNLAHHGLTDTGSARHLSICSDVVAAEAPVIIEDIAARPRYADEGFTAGGARLRAYAGVPIFGGDGLPLGSLCVLDHRPRPFAPAQVEQLSSLADQLAELLELERLSRRTTRRRSPGPLPDTRRLRRALDAGELVPHYQPVVSLVTGEVTGFEALIRWEHPEHGLLPPAEFLPAIETSGLMRPVGRRILQTVLSTLADLRHGDRRDGSSSLVMSVNVSGEQLRSPGLASFVLDALARHDLPESALVLEITESELLSDYDVAAAELGRLGERGVGIGLDDYGTGWSGLDRLLQLPFTAMKLDHTLTARLGGDTRVVPVIRSTLDLAASLGLTVVVEGVETTEQATTLRALGCDLAQGWLFGRPVPVEGLPSVLDPRAPARRRPAPRRALAHAS